MFSRKIECPQCGSKVKKDFDFCPYCGCGMKDSQREQEDYGLLGRNELAGTPLIGGGNLGFTDKLVQSLFNSLVKGLEKGMKDANRENTHHVQSLPNGVRIQIGMPVEKEKKPRKGVKTISKDQIKKMSGLPRVEAKTKVRRIGDKVFYELKAENIDSVDDVFVSRVESGYEIKAIGKKKVYVNTLPVDLPLRGYSISEQGLIVEFGAH